jgi:hypothetical protein
MFSARPREWSLPTQKAQDALPVRLSLCLELPDPLVQPGVYTVAGGEPASGKNK